ncbi:putative DNA-binding ribbon-helix-helix protein [Pseudochelatococcus lubricantis]|uniref:DNA-binding ribbon-helix-helix protein n=1 Tax=Pseudochelatococcus lubricantis TaxID=1538102 RepID=A0ABX0UZ18_9HYPH|nr:ribbon-helix-helix domain-containing protein [Pseudochelatococcus lubricantis]NIJ58148.1 putative DNA-binding ribbon-helix-helix protein [Pseudochelatococcus lubricantis]
MAVQDVNGSAVLSSLTTTDLAGLSQPEFRAIATPRGRTGVRLEVTFWRALANLCERDSLPMPLLVASIVESARRQGINATSALRCYVVHRLVREAAAVKAVSTVAQRIQLLIAAPIPSIALTGRGDIICTNIEFIKYLRIHEDSAFSDSALKLEFDVPIDALVSAIQTRGRVESGLNIAYGAIGRRTIARVVPVPPLPAEALVAYVLQ